MFDGDSDCSRFCCKAEVEVFKDPCWLIGRVVEDVVIEVCDIRLWEFEACARIKLDGAVHKLRLIHERTECVSMGIVLLLLFLLATPPLRPDPSGIPWLAMAVRLDLNLLCWKSRKDRKSPFSWAAAITCASTMKIFWTWYIYHHNCTSFPVFKQGVDVQMMKLITSLSFVSELHSTFRFTPPAWTRHSALFHMFWRVGYEIVVILQSSIATASKQQETCSVLPYGTTEVCE